MKLYLVQHGKAVDKAVDPGRPLSREGRAEVESSADFLVRHTQEPVPVWHSGKVRALQTAEIFARRLSAAAEVHPGLAPMDDPAPIAQALANRQEDLLLVSHLPFLDRLASLLIAGGAAAHVVAFRNAGVVCIERTEASGWHLLWAVTPELAQ